MFFSLKKNPAERADLHSLAVSCVFLFNFNFWIRLVTEGLGNLIHVCMDKIILKYLSDASFTNVMMY